MEDPGGSNMVWNFRTYAIAAQLVSAHCSGRQGGCELVSSYVGSSASVLVLLPYLMSPVLRNMCVLQFDHATARGWTPSRSIHLLTFLSFSKALISGNVGTCSCMHYTHPDDYNRPPGGA